MKKIYVLLFVVATALANNASALNPPSDTLREAKYSLSSRNAEAQSGKFKKVDLALAFDRNTKSYGLTIGSEKEIGAFLEISDQDENVIYFKQIEIKAGTTKISFIGEDGNQTLFRFAFSEPYAEKPAVFIIREEGTGDDVVAAEDLLR